MKYFKVLVVVCYTVLSRPAVCKGLTNTPEAYNYTDKKLPSLIDF